MPPRISTIPSTRDSARRRVDHTGKLLRSTGLFEPIAAHIAAGKPVFGTCAGMILLAKRLENDDNVYFGALDATVRRNAYGRQLGSFASTADFGDIKDFPLVFIRGPFVSDVGADATIETEVDGRVVVCDRATFSPRPSTPNSPTTPAFTSYF